jgi:isochorismate synthase
VVQKLHPTPAVCGVPKRKALRFIKENEGYDRMFYTGFLGELNKDFTQDNPDTTDLYVNLRCMKIKNQTAELYMGCGITQNSIPEKEYAETVNKSHTMKAVIQACKS